MSNITQKRLYDDAIIKTTTDHEYQTKWVDKLQTVIIWEEVWKVAHNFLLTSKTKTIIWEQIHLNFYTQYSYNKWHKTSSPFPLCKEVPKNIYHMILHCKFVNQVWIQAQPLLNSLHEKPITDEEKALGIVNMKGTADIMLRNWVTFKLREQIMFFERKASKSSRFASLDNFKAKFNQSMALEIKQHLFRYQEEGNLSFFDKVIAHQGILCEKNTDGKYQMKVFLV